MCLAVPGKVKKIIGKQAVIDYQNEERTVLLGEELVKAGDFVLVQMGIVVKVLSSEETKETLSVWKKLGGK